MQAIVYLSMISILLLGLPKFEVSSIHATWVIVRGGGAALSLLLLDFCVTFLYMIY